MASSDISFLVLAYSRHAETSKLRLFDNLWCFYVRTSQMIDPKADATPRPSHKVANRSIVSRQTMMSAPAASTTCVVENLPLVRRRSGRVLG